MIRNFAKFENDYDINKLLDEIEYKQSIENKIPKKINSQRRDN